MRFLSCDVVLKFSRGRPISIYEATRKYGERDVVRTTVERPIACYSVMACCGIINLTRIKWLID